MKRQLLVNRINQLPDHILTYILSFLPIREAARTSIISKRWIDLWLCCATLDFHAEKMWEGIEGTHPEHILRNSKRSEYVKWVNKVLQSHKALVLDLFRIRFDLVHSSRDDIDKWLQYAFARRVKRLDLNLLRYNDKSSLDELTYAFPHDLHSTAISLSVPFGNGMTSGALFRFESLRSLSFKNVNVSGEVLRFFLHNCPSLEYLAVDRSLSLIQLEVCGPSLALKHLEIMWCVELRSLIVCDTNIVSLKFTAGNSLVLNNVPMLVDVYVCGNCLSHLVGVPITWISCCLSTLTVLTLLISDTELVWGRDTDVALPQLTKLKVFTLSVEAAQDGSLIVFTALIRASPNLEKFVLQLEWLPTIDRLRKESAKALAFPLKHLKVVEIFGYYGRITEVELIEYFVENAVALQRITVDPRDQPLLGSHIDNLGAEEIARNLAKQQLPKLVPPHVELLIL